MRISKEKWIFVGAGLLAIVVGALMVSCSKSDVEKAETVKPTKLGIVPVEVQEVKRTTVTETISAVGTVEAWHDVLISSESAGKITAIHADKGDHVEKGEIIVKLDSELKALAVTQAEAQLLMARANHKKAIDDLKRSEELFRSESISESQIELARLQAETAEANLKLTEAALKMARRQLKDTEVKSPIDGRVAERYVDVGETVAPGTPVAVVVDISRMRVRIGIAEEEIAKVREGQRAYLSVDAYPDERFEGEISNVGLKADFQTRSFPVEIEVTNNTGEKLKPGMIARVGVEVGRFENALLIPQDAVLERGNERIVYVVASDKAVRRSLSLGRQWDEMVMVEGGLEKGDRLVVAGQEGLSEGMKVKVEGER